MKDIQKLINQTIPVIDNHPFPDDGTEVFEKAKPQQRRNHTPRGNSGGNSGNNKGSGKSNRYGAKRN